MYAEYEVLMLGLFCFQAEVDKNIELLRKKDEELSSALEKMENQSENNDIDEVIIPTAPLYKQILNLYAEENAIEDTIFYLGEALRRGVIDLDVFLKVRLPRSAFQDLRTHVLKEALTLKATNQEGVSVGRVKIPCIPKESE